MLRLRLSRIAPKLRTLATHTAAISAAIVAVVMAVDYILNIQILRDATGYTPMSTLAIVLLIAPPATFVMLLQTERVREAQSELAAEQSARAAAEAANAARARFLANISHELRTPLNGVIGYSELLLETAEAEDRAQDAQDLQRVVGSARRLLALLNDLLDLAKVDANKLTLSYADVCVRELIEEVVQLATPTAQANGSAITVTIDDALRTARTDPLRLTQCLLNLVSNAAKFTMNGSIAVEARSENNAGVEWLAISVRDTGLGIAHERQPLLFEPFMQAQALESSADMSGAGLGLALTRELARLMGGDVTFISAPRQGSTFTLRIPLHGEANSNAAASPSVSSAA